MSVVLDKMRQEVEKLTPEEKILLADELLVSYGKMRPEAEEYWREELKRRAQLEAEGKMTYITLDEFREKYRERLDNYRSRTSGH